MEKIVWAVWKDCRLAGYVQALSEGEATAKSIRKFGGGLFVERSEWPAQPREQSQSDGHGTKPHGNRPQFPG